MFSVHIVASNYIFGVRMNVAVLYFMVCVECTYILLLGICVVWQGDIVYYMLHCWQYRDVPHTLLYPILWLLVVDDISRSPLLYTIRLDGTS